MKVFMVGQKMIVNRCRIGLVTAICEFGSFPIEVTFSESSIEYFTRDGRGDCSSKPILKIVKD
jgi:hypothetical protein